ncbi:MAG: sugar ABC transporter permease [Atribacterota bacterium]
MVYFLIAPALFFVVGILGYSVVKAFLMSLRQIDMYTFGEPFVGLRNYYNLFQDAHFKESLRRSIIFVSGTIGLGTFLALAYALCLYKVKRLRRFFRGVSLVPYLISGVAAAVMWRFLFSGNAGLINFFLQYFGLESTSWLGDPGRALLIIILANVWYITPFSTLILLSGLQSIDPEIFDAASVDGAHGVNQLRYITLPLIAPMMGVSLIWLNFASFNMFDVILPLTGGGPGRATELLAVYLYHLAFQEVNISYASAVMMVLLLINALVSFFILRISRT